MHSHSDSSRRIAGLHVEDDGRIGVCWLADDLSVLRVVDAALFRNEHFAVVADGISARGRWIPIAWHKAAEPIAVKLRDEYGCKMLPDPCSDNESFVSAMTNQMVQMLSGSRLRVEGPTLGSWLNEYRLVQQAGDIPKGGYPLMSATRHAIECVRYAKGQPSSKPATPNGMRMPI